MKRLPRLRSALLLLLLLPVLVSAVGRAEEPVGVSPRWYSPDAEDAAVSWNNRQPWGGPFKTVSLATGFHTFAFGPLALVGRSGGELLVRAGTDQVALVVGTWSPNRAFFAGLDGFRGNGVVLYDFGEPDVQVGVLLPDVQLRMFFGDHLGTLSAGSGLTGLRVTVWDLVRIDLRGPVISGWLYANSSTPSSNALALSFGGSLDAGLVF